MSTSDKPLYVTDPEKWLEEINKAHHFVCVMFFRGSWCKFDEHYLKRVGDLNLKEMKKEGVYLIAWTGEGAEGAQKADEQWGLTKHYGFAEVIGDETLSLANYLKEDEILPNLIISTPEEAKAAEHVTPGTYPNGIAQPGMVFYAHHGNLACHWEAKADSTNLFGGANRPEPSEVWVQVLKRKHALDHGNAIMPVHADACKTCTHVSDVAGCSVM